MRGYNDDLVMACAIACWVRDTALVINQHDVAYKKAMLSSIMMSTQKMDTNIEGMKGYKRRNKHMGISINDDGFPFFIG